MWSPGKVQAWKSEAIAMQAFFSYKLHPFQQVCELLWVLISSSKIYKIQLSLHPGREIAISDGSARWRAARRPGRDGPFRGYGGLVHSLSRLLS